MQDAPDSGVQDAGGPTPRDCSLEEIAFGNVFKKMSFGCIE